MQTTDTDGVTLTDTWIDQVNAQVRAHIKTRVQVDWNRDGDWTDAHDDISDYVISWTVDRSTTSSAPDGTRLTVGQSASTATITVGPLQNAPGDPETATETWSSYNTESIFYGFQRTGCPLRVDVGFPSAFTGTTPTAWQYVRRFTGWITRISPGNLTDGTAVITATDSSSRLTAKTRIPVVVSDDSYGLTQSRWGGNSQWFLDYCLRAGNIYTTPPPDDTTVVSITGRGTLAPDIGLPVSAYQITPISFTDTGNKPAFTDGRYGLAIGNSLNSYTDQAATSASFIVQPTALTGNGTYDGRPTVGYGNDSVLVEAWIKTPTVWNNAGEVLTQFIVSGNGQGSGTGARIVFGITDAGRLTCFTRGLSTGNTLTDTVTLPTGQWVYVGWWQQFTTDTETWQCTFATGTTTRRQQSTTGAFTPVAALFGGSTVGRIPIEGIQMKCGTGTLTFAGATHTSTAILEPGLNQIGVSPYDSDAQTAWDIITNIVDAELGFAGFDEYDRFRFYNRYHSNGNTILTVSDTNQVLDVSSDEDIDAIVNHATGTAAPLVVQPEAWQWTSGDAIQVPAGGSTVVNATFDNPAVNVPSTFTPATMDPIPTPDSASPTNYYRASTRNDAAGGWVEGLTFTIDVSVAGATVTITNPYGYPVWLVSPATDSSNGTAVWVADAGQPCLQIAGQAIASTSDGTAATDTTVDVLAQSSIDKYGEKAWDAPQNEWVQNTRSLRTLILDILGRCNRPIPQPGPIPIAGDPRLQLFDLICLEVNRAALQQLTEIYGVSDTFDPSGTGVFTQSLTGNFVAGPNGFILGDPGNTGRPSQGILKGSTVLGGLG